MDSTRVSTKRRSKTEDRRPESLLILELLKLQGNYGLPERFVPLQTKKNR